MIGTICREMAFTPVGSESDTEVSATTTHDHEVPCSRKNLIRTKNYAEGSNRTRTNTTTVKLETQSLHYNAQ